MRLEISPTDADGAFAPVAAALLRRSAELTARQLEELRAIRSYRRLPKDALARSCRRNVIRVAQMLCGDADLPDDVDEDEHQSGRHRAMQGIPAEDVVAAYRRVMRVLRDAVVECAAEAEVPLETTLRGVQQLWELVDEISNELVAARRQIDVEIARREEQQRLTFLARVLSGGLPAGELVKIGGAYNLVPDGEYWVLRARVAPAAAPAALKAIEAAARSSRRSAALAGPVDGDLAGILSTRPVLPDLDGVAAVSGPVHLPALSHAYAEATRLLNVAIRFRRTGLVDQSSLSIRIAVVEEGELGEALFARYLAPVLATGPGAEALLGTVATYLRADCSVARGAADLSIHQNTLRHRLGRFEQLARVDLSGLEATFEVWWALQYWTLHRTGSSAAV
ncbi:MAG TPA: helix-turn-helix domain-containing protein [Sporichthyaceae bacterium]|jgi:hypothetical protein|nr:helix-turn-helix domain-containing protein [Sporichthyaceae bacterium]